MEKTLTTPCNLSKTGIQSLAERVAKVLEYQPGDDLQAMVVGWGHRITYVEADDHPESLRVDAEGKCEFFLPRHTSPARDRFTLAHELGHLFLHHTQGAGASHYNRSGTDLAEVQANWFAAAFLMPEESFQADMKSSASLASVARKYGVSLAAAEVRARSLGLAPAA